ncbi:MAG: HAMP domain-containing sensor histidine kinase [Ferruginibacter sp.]
MMVKNRFNNLFWRISVVFFVLLVFIGLSYVYITIHYSGRYFEEVSQQLNKNVAADIAAHSTPFTNGKVNEHAMEDMFDHVMSINPGLEVYLLDNSGKILSFYAPAKKIVLDKINLEPVQQFINSNGTKYLTGSNPRHPEVQKIFSAAPVMSEGVQSGYIYVVLASDEYEAISQSLTKDYLLQVGLRAMLLTLLATLLVGLLVIKVITHNFSHIIEVMKKFREGDLSARVKVKSAGDVKQVADIFNEMADILNKNIEKLKEVEILRRELIANVSHDLRTPIAIIQGYIETLQIKVETLTEEERKRYLNIIAESTGKLEKLVSELFELSKLEANQVKPRKESFFISELVNDISSKYLLIAKEKNISITTFLSKELPPVYADVSLIERVMQNLIDNAMKFTPEGGKIIIKTSKNKEDVEVTVADNGVGIPEDEREQIFGRYYKANNFTDLKNGTGLGLAIIKKILDLHDSSLDLITKVDKGSSFVFRLPAYHGVQAN